eukprot:COSAG06_NODE_123_length_23014_cov_10.698058_10_plen_73_part_00
MAPRFVQYLWHSDGKQVSPVSFEITNNELPKTLTNFWELGATPSAHTWDGSSPKSHHSVRPMAAKAASSFIG